MSFGATRPRPRLDSDNRAFWTGGEHGQLLICQCGDCGKYLHPPQPLCRNCWSENVAPQPVSGRATVDSYTINYQPWMPGLEVPFVIARVALEEDETIYLTTNIVGCEVDEVAIGDKLQVAFEEEDGIWYPLFEKQSGGES